MVEEQQKRIDEHMHEVLENIDQPLRKMQGDAYRCAATCCDNESYSIQKVQKCVEDCHYSFSKAQKYIRGEFDRVQNRLERCIMDCNDRIKDQVGPNPSQYEIDKYTGQFDTCATKCVDNFCETLPALEKNLKKVLFEEKYKY